MGFQCSISNTNIDFRVNLGCPNQVLRNKIVFQNCQKISTIAYNTVHNVTTFKMNFLIILPTIH